MNGIKQLLREISPNFLLNWNRRRKLKALRVKNSTLSTQEVFTAIYADNMWGGDAGTFCSGSGSQFEVAGPYCEAVKNFIFEHKVTSVLDIGCGDFSVGQRLQMPRVKYIGIDLVPELIKRNIALFGSDTIGFKCLNAIDDQLPYAELVLVRQVFQHLSNEQISKVLDKLREYRYVMVTEHYPAPNIQAVPNIDKPHGGDTRVPDNSAVYLDQPPFNIQGVSTILEVSAPNWLAQEGEIIKTLLFCQHDY